MIVDCGTETVALLLQPLFAGNGEHGFFYVDSEQPHLLKVCTNDIDSSVKQIQKVLREQIAVCQRLLSEAF